MWAVLLAAAVFASAIGSCLATSGSVTAAMAIHGALMLTAWGLLMPAGGIAARYFKVTAAMAIHGALMLTAWGLLMPAGGIAARYFKVMPGQDFPRVVENLTWWRWHRGLQYGGMALATAALGVILLETGGRFDTLHGRCGLAVMVLGWLQVVSGLLRGTKGGPTDQGADPLDPTTWRGDHYDMTRRRHAFEAWHKPAGWVTLVLAGATILLGLRLVGSPAWLLFVVGVVQAGAGLAFIDGVVRHRWVGTYASLWGIDPRHPGNR